MNCIKCNKEFKNKDDVKIINNKPYCLSCYQHNADLCFNCCDNVLNENLFITWSCDKDYNGYRQIDQLCAKCFVDTLNEEQKEMLRKELEDK